MSDNEDRVQAYVDGLLECQRVIVAKAALAGCRFVPWMKREWSGEYTQSRRDVPYYEAYLPTGMFLGRDYRDIYEASCACMAILDANEKEQEAVDAVFALQQGNEQPMLKQPELGANFTKLMGRRDRAMAQREIPRRGGKT